jgi:tetratricopeptide (TPR) repeat protein
MHTRGREVMNIKRKKRFLLFFLFMFLLGVKFVHASPGILLKIEIQEGIPGDSSSFQLVDQREIELYNGKQTVSFQANFSLEVTPAIIPKDLSGPSQKIILSVDLITLAPEAQTIFKEISAKDNEVLFLGEVGAKMGRVYKVFLTPKIIENLKEECDLKTGTEQEGWEELPSAHFFFRYLDNSIADFHWRRIKGFAEEEYRRFREVFGFTQPAMDRMEYYLVPCRVNEVVWDRRFDIGLDPVRNKIYVPYNLDQRSLDSPNVGFLLFYRLWGYAPPLLAEGVGGYFSLSHHFTQKLIKTNKFIPLQNLKVTLDYRNQPQPAAFMEACSFVRFLIKEYTQDKFKNFYQQVTDLTFDQVLEKVYGKNLSILEKEWLSFLDGYKDVEADLRHLATVKMSYRHFDEAQELYEDMLNLFGRDVGTLRSLAYLFYLKGEYEESEKYYLETLSKDSLNVEYLYTIGNTNYLEGRYDEARKFYAKCLLLDSTHVEAYIKLGELDLLQGDFLLAQDHFNKAETMKAPSQDKVDIYLGLGKVFEKLQKPEEAQESFKKALNFSEDFLFVFPEDPLPYLKKGEVLFNLGEMDSAINYLKIAEFLEDRPLYQGRVFLALGKAYEKKGDRKRAGEYYNEVLDLPTGFEEKKEAEELLKSK